MFQLLTLHNCPIFRQLQIEEGLLRTDHRNWCILNYGSTPAIVMGISGQPDQLIDEEHHQRNPIPIIRRFSGGGTVVVDAQTLFVTWIGNAADLQISCCPRQILQWTERFYAPLFPSSFCVQANDYAFDALKFGGNAQYLCKERWLHHSSLLWDYDPHHMRLLKIPTKRPAYRQDRSHADFLCTLKDHFPSPQDFFTQVKMRLEQQHTVISAEVPPFSPHRQATTFVELH